MNDHYSKRESGVLLARFGNLNDAEPGLHFKTTNNNLIQAAEFKYPADHIMRAHRHIERTPPENFRTEEVLLVWKGKIWCTIYDIDDKVIYEQMMVSGEYVIVHYGGVKYDVLEDVSIMFELKACHFTTSEDDGVLL